MSENNFQVNVRASLAEVVDAAINELGWNRTARAILSQLAYANTVYDVIEAARDVCLEHAKDADRKATETNHYAEAEMEGNNAMEHRQVAKQLSKLLDEMEGE